MKTVLKNIALIALATYFLSAFVYLALKQASFVDFFLCTLFAGAFLLFVLFRLRAVYRTMSARTMEAAERMLIRRDNIRRLSEEREMNRARA